MARCSADRQRSSDSRLRQHQAEANTEIERVPHVRLGHLTVLLQPTEQGWTLPAAGIDAAMNPGRQGARQVLRQAATGDVCHAVQLHAVLEQRLHKGAI